MTPPLTMGSLLIWMVCCVAGAFAVGYLAPIATGPFVRPEPILGFIPGVVVAAGGLALLFRRERLFLPRLVGAILVLALAPLASCEGAQALFHSRLQPLAYGVRSFDGAVWGRSQAGMERDRARSQMTAQLTLGGLLDDKRRDAIHQLLGAPDCAAKAGEDAWQLGFASTQMDPDCLHVWYDNSQRSVRAQVLQQ